MLIIFEGMDRVGKTSTITKLQKITNFQYYCLDRGPAGFYTYDIIRNRLTEDRLNEYLNDSKQYNSISVLYVYLFADKKDIEKRLIEEKTSIMPNNTSIEKTLEIYLDSVNKFYKKDKCIQINTSINSVEEVVKIILRKIEELR